MIYYTYPMDYSCRKLFFVFYYTSRNTGNRAAVEKLTSRRSIILQMNPRRIYMSGVYLEKRVIIKLRRVFQCYYLFDDEILILIPLVQ